MKVMNKTKQYNVIKVDTSSAQFYIDIGKYLNEKDYEYINCDMHRYGELKIKDQYVKYGQYILVDDNKNIRIINEKEFQDDFVILLDLNDKEGVKRCEDYRA